MEELRLSCCDCSESRRLKKDLEDSGWIVETILSGSYKPVVTGDRWYVAGYLAIRHTFVFKDPEKNDGTEKES